MSTPNATPGSEELAAFLRAVSERADDLGLTRVDIAQRSGLSKRRVYQLLSGTPPPSATTETLHRLAKAADMWLAIDGLPWGRRRP